jgi:RNA polymerase sigma factor (sigma-70 family)
MNLIPRANQEFESTWNKLHRDGINDDMLAQQNLARENIVPFWERDSLTCATALIRRRVQTFATNTSPCQLMSFAPQSSNPGALSAAIAAELPKVRRHAIGLLYNRADAEDLVQDCLETALAKQSTLQDPGRLRGWLFTILNNLFLMRMRANSRRGVTIPIDEFTDSLVASSAVDDRGMALDLARAMGELSLEHRQILLLLNVEGYRYEEIADILEMPIGTVMSRLARARQRLRALLEGHGLPAKGVVT